MLSYAEKQSWKSELRREVIRDAVRTDDPGSIPGEGANQLSQVVWCPYVHTSGETWGVGQLFSYANTHACWTHSPSSYIISGSSQLSHPSIWHLTGKQGLYITEPLLISHLGSWRGGVEGKVLAVPA